MSFINTRSYKQHTYIYYAGLRLIDFGQRLRNTAKEIRDTFIIGDALSGVFDYLGYRIKSAGEYIRDADNDITTSINVVLALIHGWGFLQILFALSNNFRRIATNPRQFVFELLLQYGWWMPILILQPLSFIKVFLHRINWVFGYLIDNPSGFLRTLLALTFPRVFAFFINPAPFIANLLTGYFGYFLSLVVNPYLFIRRFLEGLIRDFNLLLSNPALWVFLRLREFNPELWQFLSNPDQWIKNRLIQKLGLHPAFFSNPDYYFMLKVIQTVDRYLDMIKNLLKEIVIKFILRFM